MTTFAETTVPFIDARVEFWSGAGAAWPRDWHLHTFAARIVHRTGQLLYRQEWHGSEPETILIHPLPPRHDTATRRDELEWAIHLLCRYHRPYAEKFREAIFAGQPAPIPTTDEWLFAVGLSRQISNDAWSAFDRYRNVVDLLVSLLERSVLRAALRPFFLGEPTGLPAGSWYNEVYHAWFATCQVDMERPFSGVPIRAGGNWIVFETLAFELWEASVTRFGASQSARVPPEGSSSGQAADSRASGDDGEKMTDEASAGGDAASTPAGTAGAHRRDDAPADYGNRSETQSESAGAFVQKRKTGAKARYVWPPFDKAVLQRASAEDRPKSIHAMADEMLDWCSTNWGKEPAKSTVRARIAKLMADNGLSLG